MPDMLFMDLFNTNGAYYSNRSVDLLYDASFYAWWAKNRDLPLELLQSNEVPQALVELRSELKGMLDKLLAGQTLRPQDEQLLNSRLGKCPQVRVLSHHENSYELQSCPVVFNADWLLAEIVLSFVQLLISGDIRRIKICAAPDCQWMYYDESHGRTRRWCNDSCGNRMKVRRFRQRDRSEQP